MKWLANAIDRTIETVAPLHGFKRAQARQAIALANKAYDAADRNRFRDAVRDFGSGNNAVVGSGLYVRNMARHLDRNLDIVSGALNTLAQNIIGATGIGVEPQPRNRNGDVLEDLAFQLSMLHSDWSKRPEVTWQHDIGSMDRLLCRTWLRDGEVLAQELIGPVPLLDHGTRVPYSLEMIEPDLLPWDLTDPGRGITQGVQRNAWGRPVAYHLYKHHPGDTLALVGETKSVPAERVMHLRLVDRIGQVRGISLLAAVLTRLDDLKDYEESERIAAKIAACFAAFIIKGDPTMLPEGAPDRDRTARLAPGMVFDSLRPGESVGTVDTNRPNPNLEGWRNGQLRAAATSASPPSPWPRRACCASPPTSTRPASATPCTPCRRCRGSTRCMKPKPWRCSKSTPTCPAPKSSAAVAPTRATCSISSPPGSRANASGASPTRLRPTPRGHRRPT